MKKLYLGKFLDFVLWGSLLFFVSFVWARYFLRDFWLAVFVSVLTTIFVMTISRLLSIKKMQKAKIEMIRQKNASAISNRFLLMTKPEILKIFYEKLNKKYVVKSKSDFLIVSNNMLRPIYTSKKITDKDIIETYKKAKLVSPKKMIITCASADDSATEMINIIKDFEVVLLTETEAYVNIFEPLNFDVPQFETTKKEQKKFADYVAFALKKERTKNYVLVSVFMLISSFVLRYNIYYLIFSSITALLAIYSHFNTKFNKKSQKLL